MRLEKRQAVSPLALALAPICAIAFTLAVSSLLVLWAGAPVGPTWGHLVKGGFGSTFAWTETLTRATPLDLTREGARAGRSFSDVRANSLFGEIGGRGWEWVSNFLILGGLYLIYAGIIRWHIPIFVLAGLLLPATLLYFIDASRFAGPAFHLFSGGAVLGAFFIATDPVSAAATIRGRVFYGAAIGLLTYVIRTWGGYPDAIAFAVLLMNGAVPLIDRFTRPRVFGHG